MNTIHHITRGDINQARQMVRQAWALFVADLELESPDLPADGVGQADSPKRRIQWVCADAGALLAVQGTDKLRGRCWELALIPLSGDQIILRSLETVRELCPDPEGDVVRLEEDIWASLAAGREISDVSSPSNPTFPAIVAAASSNGSISAVRDDTAKVLSLEHDLQYFRDLCRSQERMLKERPAIQVHIPGPEAAAEAPAPREWRLKEIEEWATLNSDRIVILPRAISEAKKSTYENEALVFECLEMLAQEYRMVRTGESDRNAFRDRALTLGVEAGGSVEPSNAGEAGDQYFVRWGGQRRFLDQHLSKGISRDKRYSLRIYYTWDATEQKVVVGWLPSHLNNSKT